MMIKICGITNREDALVAVDAGASALGFVFFPKSPRYVCPDEVARIVTEVPAGILKVGVFVDELPREVARIAGLAALDVVQLHGRETPARAPKGLRIWKAFRVNQSWDARTAFAGWTAEAFLLDSPRTGETWDYTVARGLSQPVILAGGLDATNVAAAIEAVRPWGVDASSRLELQAGRKDHSKVRAFIQAAKAVYA